MLSHMTNWQGTLGRIAVRLIALFVLALALAGPLAVAAASDAGATAAPKSACGMATSAQPGCGPNNCAPITSADYTLPATKPRGGAQARLSRSSGVAGSLDTLTGSHWPAGATVELLLGSGASYGDFGVIPTPFAQGVADASGRLTIAGFQTPDVEQCMKPDNIHIGNNEKLFIAQTVDGKARVSLLYTFFPAPTLEMPAATDTSWMVSDGDRIFITGSGWEPGQTVIFTPAIARWPKIGYLQTDPADFERLPLAASVAQVDPNGSLATYVTVPPEPPETQVAFFASASGPRNGDVTVEMNELFSVRPLVQSTLALSHGSGVAGSTLTARGTNWPAGQTVELAYCRGQDAPLCPPQMAAGLASVIPDSAGRFTTTLTLPDDASAGPITIQASLLNSPFGASDITSDNVVYHEGQPFLIVYPFALAHPRIQMAINASPFAAAALIIGLLALAEWRRKRRGLAPAPGAD